MDEAEEVEIIPSTDFATKVLPRGISEVTALAELIDNAVEATNGNEGKRLVVVTFNDDEHSLVVEDNGRGIEDSRLVDCFCLGHSENSAGNLEAAKKKGESEPRSTVCLDIYFLPSSPPSCFPATWSLRSASLIILLSQFSRHGVGAKTAIFKLGHKAEIVTRTSSASSVSLLTIDLNAIREKKKWAARKAVDRSGRLKSQGTLCASTPAILSAD